MNVTILNTPSVARLQSLLALALMVVGLGLMTDTFLTSDNGWNILRQISVNLCLSVGMTLIIISGGIDLSVGAVLALSGAVAAGLLKQGIALPFLGVHLDFTITGAIVSAIAVGAAAGACNGLAITRLQLPPFVATLAMLSIARGLTLLWTGGFPITGLGPSFGFIGTGAWLGIPMPVWEVLVIVMLAALVCKRTAFGRHLYAVGGSERAALLAGVRVERVKLIVYVVGGVLSGVAGLLVTARLDSAQPNAGLGYELDSIAAVVIGGTSLSGGRGSIVGTVIGCLIIGVLNNGLFLLDVSPFWQQVIKGLVIIVAVALDRFGAPKGRAG
ncbi:ribose ABC transporter permease [Steroidobacter agaridevorans]|nr:ribose ABC transporter permease [Steroidobacter agaridevorans]GFE87751.1 ribose ABC transporter permease [Steroidobacter agaridevorans]